MERIANPPAPVLVFSLGPSPMQHGMLGAIRTLGRMGVDVYALVNHHLAPTARSRYVRKSFVLKAGKKEPDQLAAVLLAIGRRIGRKTILIPTDDRGAALVSEHSDVLNQWFVFPRSPRHLPRQLSNKRELYALCRTIGIPCPRFSVPASLAEVNAFVAHALFPVVVKAADAQRLPNGVRSTSIARSRDELVSIYRRAERVDAGNLIFQEYIPDFAGEDWIFHGYSNPETGCLVSFTGKKLRSYPAFAGATTVGVPAVNETLRRQTEGMLSAIGYAGIVDLDYRFDKRDGQYKLLDFNPRSGANFRMFENGAGIDVVRALYLDLTGQEVPGSPVMKQRTFIDESHDLAASVGYLRHHRLTVGAWRDSLKGRKELAWFCREDPLPALVMCSHLLSRSAMRAARTTWKMAAGALGGSSHLPGL